MKNKINKNEKIFIAGGSGMVGSAIKRELLNCGYEGNQNKILSPTRSEVNFLNLNEIENWFEINSPTVVIIAAAKVGGIAANNSRPLDFILENLKIQTNLIETSFKGRKASSFSCNCIYPKFTTTH